jgi:hypothetical protein
MAFLTLPGRNLRYPSESRVPIYPAIQPRANIATAIAQALPQLLKELDPVERAKSDAQLAYYNYLKSHPSGTTKPMTDYQRLMASLAVKKLGMAQQKLHINDNFWAPYEAALHGGGSNDSATVPATPPPPVPQASSALPQADPDYKNPNYIGLGTTSAAPSLSLSPEFYQDLQDNPNGPDLSSSA